MAYRFNGSSDFVRFPAGPFGGYTVDANTVAVLLKRNTAGTAQNPVCFSLAALSNFVWMMQLRTTNALRTRTSGTTSDSTQIVSSTSPWYLLVVTRAAGASVTPRWHVWDGTAWSHAASGAALAQYTVASGDVLDVGKQGFGPTAFLAADVVCAGIKKADTADAAVEALNVTAFDSWKTFGFDWLVGFETSGSRTNQGVGSGGDEASRSGTTLVADPPGWSWAVAPAVVTRTAAVTATGLVAVAGTVFHPPATLTGAAAAVAAAAIVVSGLGFTPVEPVPSTTLWTFMLADIDTGDDLCDLTPASLTAKIAPRLNRPLTLTLELPADNAEIRATAPDGDPNLTVGTRSIKAYRDGILRANVIVWNLSYDGDADTAKVSVTGYDPLVQLRRRPARDSTGDFSNPEFGDSVGAGPLVQGLVEDTIGWEGGLLIDPSGTCDASTPLGGNLADWPIMIFDLLTIITDTGVVDIVLEPVDDTAGTLATLNAVDSWGTDKSATVSFDYATGAHNVATARRVVDMDDFCNKLWYYLGPKIDVQHWRGNITGRDDTSVAKYGVYMDIQIYDSGQENAERELFTQLRATELAHRKDPQELLYVTPQTGAAPEPFLDYSIGDLVTVNLGTVFGPAVTAGVQRVYGFDVDVDTDGVERVSELIVSAQGE